MKKIIFVYAVICCFSFNKISAQLANGSIAPDFTLTDLNGNTHNLYTYLSQGKTVYLDFFACHCGTCWNYHNTLAIENLYLQHGPTGTSSQDVIVLAIEYDAGNGYNEFNGISGNTQGNWVSGTNHPFINPENAQRTQIINDYVVNFFPLVYGICPDKKIYNLGAQTTAQLYSFVGTCASTGIIKNTSNPNEFLVALNNNVIYIKSKNTAYFSFKLYDVSGKLIIERFIENSESTIASDDLSRGVYYYQINTNNTIYTGKILK